MPDITSEFISYWNLDDMSPGRTSYLKELLTRMNDMDRFLVEDTLGLSFTSWATHDQRPNNVWRSPYLPEE